MSVGTPWYVAPEVILKSPYNEAIDMWSLGLVLAELIVGFTLYPGQTFYDTSHLIGSTLGLSPQHVLDHGLDTEYYFNRNSNGQDHWTFKTPEQVIYETGEDVIDILSQF